MAEQQRLIIERKELESIKKAETRRDELERLPTEKAEPSREAATHSNTSTSRRSRPSLPKHCERAGNRSE